MSRSQVPFNRPNNDLMSTQTIFQLRFWSCRWSFMRGKRCARFSRRCLFRNRIAVRRISPPPAREDDGNILHRARSNPTGPSQACRVRALAHLKLGHLVPHEDHLHFIIQPIHQVKPDDLISTATMETKEEQNLSRQTTPDVNEANPSNLARLKGYEGDPCAICGHFTMIRNGTCLKCETCGATTGCS